MLPRSEYKDLNLNCEWKCIPKIQGKNTLEKKKLRCLSRHVKFLWLEWKGAFSVYCRLIPQDGKRSAPTSAAYIPCDPQKAQRSASGVQSRFTSAPVMALWLPLRGEPPFQEPPASGASTYWLFLGYLLSELLPSPWPHSDQGHFSSKDPCWVGQGRVTAAQALCRKVT